MISKCLKSLVGARGFEPPTSCSQSRRASRLRHAPMLEGFYHALIDCARLLPKTCIQILKGLNKHNYTK